MNGDTEIDETERAGEASWMKGGDQRLYESAGRLLDTPMMVLAVLLGVILLVQFFADLSSNLNTTLEAISWLIWALFVFEYLLLLWLAPNKRKMFRNHLFDLFLIVVPFLRPLRVLRLLRVAAGFGAAALTAKRVFERRGLQWILLVVVGLIAGGAALTLWFERDEPDSAIDSFGTALWWGIVTCTTVGYGDVFPVSSGGRAVAVVLMIIGVALLSVVTANIASIFVEQDNSAEVDDLQAQLESVHRKLDDVLTRLDNTG